MLTPRAAAGIIPRIGLVAGVLALAGLFGPFIGRLDAQVCSITCPANITKCNDPNQCGAVTTYPAPTPTGSCGTITCIPASGSFFPKGTTTVTCTATPAPSLSIDGAAQVNPSCTFTITVNDCQPPTTTCPANITKSTDPNQCGAVTTYPPPTATDNCPGVTSACSPASGSFFPKGTTTITCTSTDASGNTATCTFTDTVNDTQPPTVTAPPNVSGVCPGAVSDSGLGTATASDNCPGVTLTRSGVPPGNVFPTGTTTITYKATDTSGNMATATQTVSASNAHTTHGHISTVPPSHIGNVSHEHHGQHSHIVAANCPPHAPGHSPGLMPEPEERLFNTDAVSTELPDFVTPLNPDGTPMPAQRGAPVSLFGTAVGLFLGDQEEWPAIDFTPPAEGSPLYFTTSLPEVRVGSVPAKVLFSGLAPGVKGVWQINILVPTDAPTGDAVPVTVRFEGTDLKTVLLVK